MWWEEMQSARNGFAGAMKGPEEREIARLSTGFLVIFFDFRSAVGKSK